MQFSAIRWSALATLIVFLCAGAAWFVSRSRMPDVEEKPTAPRIPVALVGRWRYVKPAALLGQTLTLERDSTAAGVVFAGDDLLPVTQWTIRFGSRDPVADRADWQGGYTDGGDGVCAVGADQTGCQSMPMLCLGKDRVKTCPPFRLVTRDSLLLVGQMVLVRVQQ